MGAKSELPTATRSTWGTASYSAPELVTDHPTFTNKVDIFALGCIVFELASKRKAFTGVWKISEYAVTKRTPQISLPKWPQILQYYLSESIRELLDTDWRQRPSAAEACEIFCICSRLAHPLFAEMLLQPMEYFLTFSELRDSDYQIQLSSVNNSLSRVNTDEELVRAMIRSLEMNSPKGETVTQTSELIRIDKAESKEEHEQGKCPAFAAHGANAMGREGKNTRSDVIDLRANKEGSRDNAGNRSNRLDGSRYGRRRWFSSSMPAVAAPSLATSPTRANMTLEEVFRFRRGSRYSNTRPTAKTVGVTKSRSGRD